MDRDEQIEKIRRRWREIDAELEDLHAGRVVEGSDPATREGELLEELDALEYEWGLLGFERGPGADGE